MVALICRTPRTCLRPALAQFDFSFVCTIEYSYLLAYLENAVKMMCVCLCVLMYMLCSVSAIELLMGF